ncbi:MAG: inositol monophosphatase [Acidimicrobiales bacterium]|jgi:myo-inositol-1(or 4)-monophosphatase
MERSEKGGFRAETEAAVLAAQAGLQLALCRAGAEDIRSKGGRDLVTATDVAVEDAVRDVLGNAFKYPVVGEERGGAPEPGMPYWLVDPICGTRNFASAIPLFAVNVALVEEDQVALGAVADGSSGAVYCAEHPRGAFAMKDGPWQTIATSPGSQTIVVEGFPAAGERRDGAARFVAEVVRGDKWDFRCFGSTLSLAYLATGKVAACVFLAAPTLHVAAGVALAREAGATITELSGRPWAIGSSTLVAASEAGLAVELSAVAEATRALG